MKLKKWKSVLVILVLIIVLGGAYFLVFYKSYKSNVSALEAIPDSAGLIVQIQSPYESLPKIFDAHIWTYFEAVPSFHQAKNNYFFLDTLMRSSERIVELTQFAPIYASAHPSKDRWEWLYTFNPRASVTWQFIDQFILNAYKNAQIEKIKSAKSEIHRLKLHNENQSSFYYALHKNVFACSFDYALVENTLKAIDEKKKNEAAFAVVQKTINPNASIVLFLQQSAFSKLIESLFAYEDAAFWQKTSRFTNWTSAEMQLKENYVQFFGSTVADSSSYFLHQFSNAENRAFSSIELLPSNTYFFAAYSFHADLLKAVSNETSALQNIYNEICTFSTYENDVQKTFHYTLITYTDAASKVEELFEGQTPLSFFDEFTYGKMTTQEALSQLPFSLLKNEQTVYFSKVNDKIIFCEQAEGLRKYLQKYTTKQFLLKNPVFQEYNATLAEKSVLHLYLNTKEVPDEHFYSEWKREEETLKAFPITGVQFSRKSTIFSFNFSFLFTEKITQKALKNWTVKLDAKPVYISDAKHDVAIKSSFIIVQDELQNIYSIDQKGNIKWKRKIDGWLTEDPTSVYFNGKTGGLTFIFNTEDKLYAIDNRGHDAKGFEKGKAIQPIVPISVFKYEEGVYRIFEITKQQQIKIYDQLGKVVPGWKIPNLQDNIIMPVHYQNFNGKEHLIFLMQNGQILITDRQGNAILKKESGFRISNENGVLVFNKDLSTSGWALTDDDGVFTIIYFDDKKKNDKITGYPKSKLFAYQPIIGNEIKSVWLWDDKRVVLSNRSGNTQATFELLETSEKAPSIVSVMQKPYVQLLSTAEQKIYLLNTELSLIESFPRNYTGTAKMTDMTQDQLPELIIGEDHHFLTSYTIAF